MTGLVGATPDTRVVLDAAALPGGRPSEHVAPQGERNRTWIGFAVVIGLAVDVPALILPATPLVLNWFLPAGHMVMAAIYLTIAALGLVDAQSRRHGRSLVLSGAAIVLGLLAIPKIVLFPGVVPGFALAGSQSSALLFIVMNLAAPSLLAVALLHRGRPLPRPGHAVAVTVALAVGAAAVLTALSLVLAAVLPATMLNLRFTPLSHVLAALALVPGAVVLVLVLSGSRGDRQTAPSIAAALVILGFQEVASAMVGARFEPLWIAQNVLFLAVPPTLLVGQLGVYRALVRAERQGGMEAAFLYDAARALTASVDPAAILDRVVGFTAFAIATNSDRHDLRSSIFAVAGSQATMVAEHDMMGGRHRGVTFAVTDHEFIARAVGERATVLGAPGQLAGAPAVQPAASIRSAGLRHGVYVPVLSGGDVVGVLSVAGRLARAFSPGDIRLIEGLASVASLALTNAAGFRELEAQRIALAGSEERLRGILDSALDAVVTMDDAGAVTGWSTRAEAVFGWTNAEAVGRDLADLVIPPADRANHRAGLARFLSGGPAPMLGRVVEVTAVRRGGEHFPVEMAITQLVGAPAGVTFVGFLREATERRRAATIRELRYNVARELSTAVSVDEVMPRLFELVAQAFGWDCGQLWVLEDGDRDSGALHPSHRWAVPGLDVSAFTAASDALDTRRGFGTIGRAWVTGEALLVGDVIHHADFMRVHGAALTGLRAGIVVPVVSDAETIGVLEFLARDEAVARQDTVEVVVDTARQLGQFMGRKRAEAALRESADRLAAIAATDPLTGLKNRREFERVLGTVPRQPFAVLAIDVDGLKPINDEFGHEAGDSLLQAVSTTLNGLVRGWDVVARIGGDEFAVILPGARAGEAELVAERMRVAMHSTSAPHGQPRISVGWAAAPAGADAPAIWRVADEQLYRAKRAGRDRVEGTEATADGGTHDLPRVSADGETLTAVLAAGVINVVYQPIVRLEDRAVIGNEALARPDGAADDEDVSGLFAAARRIGRIRDLDWICRRAAVRDAHRAGLGGTLFVNVSAIALLDPVHDVDQLLMLLRSAQRSPESLVLELTEQEPVADLERLRLVARAYREHGIRFAVDDVGEGHSTLEVLAALNPEFIKLAASLSATSTHAGSRAAIEAALGFARSNGAVVIAEGVENEATARRLAELGVQAGQGFHLGRPAKALLAVPRRHQQKPRGPVPR